MLCWKSGSAPRRVLRHPIVAERVLVVIPALNERRSIGQVVAGVRSANFDCLVVDDGSTDDTFEQAGRAGARAVRLPVNLGVGGALRTAFRYAVDHGYHAVIQCDGDGQHPPELIEQLVATAQETGGHLVIGSRFLPGAQTFRITRARRLAMSWLSFLVRAKSGLRVEDTTSGFRCISEPLLGEFARSFPVHYLGDTFEAVLVAARSGYLVTECPIRIDERAFGETSAPSWRGLRSILRASVVALGGLTFRIGRFEPGNRVDTEL